MTPTILTPEQRRLLDFEARWHNTVRRDGAKEAAIAREFGFLNVVAYYQRLNALLDNPAALAYSPVLVNRLRRRRDARGFARPS